MSTSSNPSSSGVRPHRRILLTQGADLSVPASVPEHPASAATPSAAVTEPTDFVRVVAYLTPEEMQKLDTAWLQLRGKGVAANKADIMRAALMLTVSDPDALAEFLKPSVPASFAAKNSSSRRRTP